MINRLTLHELKKDLKLMLPIFFQLTCAIVLIVACVSSVVSRFKYYTPCKDIISKNGSSFHMSSMAAVDSSFMKDKLIKCEAIYMSYFVDVGSSKLKGIAYDDYLMKCYKPKMASGKWVISAPDKEYPQVMAPEGSEYSIGDVIKVESAYGGSEYIYEIAGIYKTNQNLLYFNQMIADIKDCRMFFSNDEAALNKVLMSLSEAKKYDTAHYPEGLGFVIYSDDITEDELLENSITLGNYGCRQTFDNAVVYKNSRKYVYSQLADLIPILLCVSLLLMVSVISVNSIVTLKRLRTYSTYRICGLTSYRCALITAAKSLYISVPAMLVYFVLSIVKDRFTLFSSFILEIGAIQTAACIIFLLLNIAISYAVCITIIQKNELSITIKNN